MNRIFVDTQFFLAIVNPSDQAHFRATSLSASNRAPLVTTAWVMSELANSLSRSAIRSAFITTLERFELAPKSLLVPATNDLFRRGIELYRNRSDKQWSLTDCISFLVMEESRIRDALTGDHHFEQAGFVALLK